MKEIIIKTKSYAFAIRIVKLYNIYVQKKKNMYYLNSF